MTGEVSLVRAISAPRAALWRACSTVDGLQTWYADRVEGSLDRGGTVRLEWPELGAGVELSVTEVVPDRRIVLASEDSRVTMEVAEARLSLRHEGLDAEADLEGFRSSWQVAMALLAHALERHAGDPRRTRWYARPVRVTPGTAHLCFTQSEALGRWLGKGRDLGHTGDEYALTLDSGQSVSGRILASVPNRDVALCWREQHDSVLVMRTLPSPRAGGERVVALCWSTWAPPWDGERALDRELARCVDRLAGMLAMGGSA